jgi:hypothetical protein
MTSRESDYVHRFNPNGTTDSICKSCFLTVASAIWEADLDSAEREHKCDPFRLKSLRKSVQRANEAAKSTGSKRMKQSLAC